MRVFYFGADASWEEIQKTGFRRRNTCILQALVQNNKTEQVFAVRKGTRKEFFQNLFTVKEGKVRDIVYASLLPEALFKKLGFPFLNKSINNVQIRLRAGKYHADDIIWCYWPKGLRAALDSGVKGQLVFDADHNIIDDPQISKEEKAAQEKILIEAGKRSAYLLSSAVSMINWFNQKGFQQTVRLRNGVDADRFQHIEKKDNKQFVVGYCGTLSKWIDYSLFVQLVQRNPDWKFVIIGKPYLSEESKQLSAYSNVDMQGEKKADEVALLMPGFDAAINLYRKHPALDADSMKLYEYIAAGVPVVSTTYHPGLKEDFQDLILLADTIEELESRVLQLKNNQPDSYRDKSREFLKEASWNKRVDDFLQTLNKERAGKI